MADGYSISDAFQVDSVGIKESRILLSKMLSETVDIDFPKKGDQPFALRFYQMTKSEYEISESHCFKAVFENFEAYCYDFRRLVNERYLTFDSEVSFLPIVLSTKRWEKINQIYGSAMKKFAKKDPSSGTFINGIFLWPLFNEERMSLLRNSSAKPILFLHSDGFEIKFESNDPKIFSDTMRYFDKEVDKRFLPKESIRSPKKLSPEEEKSLEPAYLSFQKRMLDQLTSLDIQQSEWDKFQSKGRSFFFSLLEEQNQEQVFDTVLLSFLTEHFEKQ